MFDNGIGFKDVVNITKPYFTTKTRNWFRFTYCLIINDHGGDMQISSKIQMELK